MEVDVPCMTLSPDGELIVVGDSAGELKVFTSADCRLVHMEAVHSAGISAIAASRSSPQARRKEKTVKLDAF